MFFLQWKGKNPHDTTVLPNPGKDRIHHRTPNFKETAIQESRVSENTNAFLPGDPGKDNHIRDSSLLSSSSSVMTTDFAKVDEPRPLTSQVSKRLEFAFQRRKNWNASNVNGGVTEYTDGKSSDTYITDGKRKSSNSCNQNGCLQIIANQVELNPNKNYQLGYMLMIASEVEKSSSSFNNIKYVRPSTDDKGEHSQTGCAQTNQCALPTNKTDDQPIGSLNVCLEVDLNTYSMFTDQCRPTVNMALINETSECDTQKHIINTIIRTDAVKTHSPAVKVALDAAQELDGEPEDRLPGAKKYPDDKNFGDGRSLDCDVMKVTDLKEQRFGLSTLNKSYLHVNGLSQTCETQHAAVKENL